MKILGLFSDGFGGMGGIAEFNRRFMTAAVASSEVTQFDAYILHGHDTDKAHAVGVMPRNNRPMSRLGFSLSTLLRASIGRPDLVICGHINFLPLAAAAALAGGSSLWLIVHGIDAWQSPDSRLTRWGMRYVDRVLAVSNITRDRMLKWSGLSPDVIKVLPNTIDLNLFTPGPKPRYLQERYGTRDKRVLYTLGRLSASEAYKGHEEVIRALPELLGRGMDVVYLIGGDGDDRSRLRALATELHLDEWVIFAGKVPEEEKVDHYRLADAYVMPGRGEGFGIVYLEAMSCGVPVVGSSLDGARDALREGALGILVNPDDPQDVVRGLLASLAQKRGRPIGLEYFDLAHFAERVDQNLKDYS